MSAKEAMCLRCTLPDCNDKSSGCLLISAPKRAALVEKERARGKKYYSRTRQVQYAKEKKRLQEDPEARERHNARVREYYHRNRERILAEQRAAR